MSEEAFKRESFKAPQTPAQKLFAEMPPERKAEFLKSVRARYGTDALVKMFGLSSEDVKRYLPTFQAAGLTKKKGTVPEPEVQAVPSSLVEEAGEPSPLTPENTHAVVYDEVIYPEKSYYDHVKLPFSELRRLIESACEIAEHNHKPYVQISFANGTRVFTYKKSRPRREGYRGYVLSVVKSPGVIDDFAK